VGTQFLNRSYEARAELLHGKADRFSGVVGAQVSRSDFSAAGDEAFLPPSLTRALALFVFQELPSGPVTWQYGVRGERQEVQVKDGRADRVDRVLSGALGAVRKFGDEYAVAFSLTRTERAPNAQELFADGPHAGTHAYEIGDPDLDREKSLGAELSLRRRTGRVTGEFALFAHRFAGYIFEQATGGADAGTGLEIYRTVQRDARFWGAELETVWHLHEGARHRLDLRLAGDLTRARDDLGHLPRIPPARALAGLAWSAGAWSAGADWQHALAQRRTAAGETSTAGYNLARAYATYRFALGSLACEAFVRATNLLDAEARLHPSFLKDEAPLPGRSLAFGVSSRF
jgi:iron complex outermembrane recepter protein